MCTKGHRDKKGGLEVTQATRKEALWGRCSQTIFASGLVTILRSEVVSGGAEKLKGEEGHLNIINTDHIVIAMGAESDLAFVKSIKLDVNSVYAELEARTST